MIGINRINGDANGSVVIYENTESRLKRLSSRVSRVATLDGGAVITHGGVSDGDRTLSIRAEISEATEAVLNEIRDEETLLHISTEIGYFSGAISSLETDRGDMRLEFLVKEKLSA